MLTQGPIDKLDVRIPRGTNLVRILDRELRPSNANRSSLGTAFHGTKYYSRVADLRRYSLRSILFFDQKDSGNHKLEIVGTGTMHLSDIMFEVKRVFEFDPMEAEIMRIDFAVDVSGYTVEWFRQNARVARKRYTSEFNRSVSERKRVETLYFGQRPNLFRVYDKTEERRVEYERLHSRWNGRDPIPTFKERYGQREDDIVTRIERQYGRARVPKAIRTLGQLQNNAAHFDPYGPFQFLPNTISDEWVNELSGDKFLKGHGWLRLREQYGAHQAKRLLDKKSCRNTNRLLAELTMSMSADRASKPPDLLAIFKEAIIQQVSA